MTQQHITLRALTVLLVWIASTMTGCSGCTRKEQIRSDGSPESKASNDHSKKNDYVTDAKEEIERELDSKGIGVFELNVHSISENEPAHVVFDASVTCKLGWKLTDDGFRLAGVGNDGPLFELATENGQIIGAAGLDGQDLTQISLKGRFVRQTDEEGKVLLEGDERLLDFVGWPNGMSVSSFSSDSQQLMIRSPTYRMTWQKSAEKLEDGFYWQLMSAEPTEIHN
ncbi:MAG: hypothetical protein SFV81_28865 [Pirellulaceae bacterium]|nr:hypothetical protein [Pirellulaceae bacterium]